MLSEEIFFIEKCGESFYYMFKAKDPKAKEYKFGTRFVIHWSFFAHIVLNLIIVFLGLRYIFRKLTHWKKKEVEAKEEVLTDILEDQIAKEMF